jgi:hypothetical protein
MIHRFHQAQQAGAVEFGVTAQGREDLAQLGGRGLIPAPVGTSVKGLGTLTDSVIAQ